MKHKINRESLRLLTTTNYSNRTVGERASISHNTAKRYRQIIRAADLDWQKINSMSDTALTIIFYPRKKEKHRRHQPDWAAVYTMMQKKHQTLLNLWENYRLENPSSSYSYSQFTNKYRAFSKKVDITMRQMHRAGECIFLDFAGRTIPYGPNDKKENAQIFISVPGCSNYTFAHACRDQSLSSWIAAHIAMFDFYGGVFDVLVPDNLKSAVTKAGDFPVINRTYLEMARHYGCFIEPARARKPRDKSKVENGVLFVSRWIIAPLREQSFNTLEELNAAIAILLTHLNNRPFKQLPGTRASRFEEIDKPALKPLPESSFNYMVWARQQKVPSDYHIFVQNHAYSVPHQNVGDVVEARYNDAIVEIFYDNKRIATHKRNFEQGSHTTDLAHMPQEHRDYAQQSREDYLLWAHSIGDNAVEVVQAQFHEKSSHSYRGARACSRLQKLKKLYGKERFELACGRASDLNSLTVKTIDSILKRNTENWASPESMPQQHLPVHSNIRGAGYYSSTEISL